MKIKFDTQNVKLNYKAAIHHLGQFLEIPTSEKEILKLHLEYAINNATLKLLHYRKKYGVNMEKEELLRDVVFIGTSLFEKNPTNPIYYKAVVKACFALIEIATNQQFEKEFIKKLLRAYNDFLCNNSQFFTEAFYFIFKSHFRVNNK